ncbi:hypothetical protein Ga0080574_TMP2350 [Salipiger abyssi]|uniref:Uncharacterized protein n=1 Tax=Salipiger abyssi TaxID=1250539 RepID=A0A1P8UTD7_9RHOB|nr:hypothetical protein Ga0080574_TMP2350 [Salipiger abyssi]
MREGETGEIQAHAPGLPALHWPQRESGSTFRKMKDKARA